MILFSNNANQLCGFFVSWLTKTVGTVCFSFQVLKAIRANPEVKAKMD